MSEYQSGFECPDCSVSVRMYNGHEVWCEACETEMQQVDE